MNYLVVSSNIVYSINRGFDVVDQLDGGIAWSVTEVVVWFSLPDYPENHCLLLRAAKKEEILRLCMDISIDQRFLEIIICCREYFLSQFEIVAMALRNVNKQQMIEGIDFGESMERKIVSLTSTWNRDIAFIDCLGINISRGFFKFHRFWKYLANYANAIRRFQYGQQNWRIFSKTRAPFSLLSFHSTKISVSIDMSSCYEQDYLPWPFIITPSCSQQRNWKRESRRFETCRSWQESSEAQLRFSSCFTSSRNFIIRHEAGRKELFDRFTTSFHLETIVDNNEGIGIISIECSTKYCLRKFRYFTNIGSLTPIYLWLLGKYSVLMNDMCKWTAALILSPRVPQVSIDYLIALLHKVWIISFRREREWWSFSSLFVRNCLKFEIIIFVLQYPWLSNSPKYDGFLILSN